MYLQKSTYRSHTGLVGAGQQQGHVIPGIPTGKLQIREIENISRGPTSGDFINILTEASMQDITVARLQSTDTGTDSPLPPLLYVMYCVRVSLWTVKIFLAQH
jgi:hypothetical protein